MEIRSKPANMRMEQGKDGDSNQNNHPTQQVHLIFFMKSKRVIIFCEASFEIYILEHGNITMSCVHPRTLDGISCSK